MIAFIANETISIIENAGLMGVPIPSVIVKAIEVLKKKAESAFDCNRPLIVGFAGSTPRTVFFFYTKGFPTIKSNAIIAARFSTGNQVSLAVINCIRETITNSFTRKLPPFLWCW